MNPKTEYVNLLRSAMALRCAPTWPIRRASHGPGCWCFRKRSASMVTFATSRNGSRARVISPFRPSCFIAPRPAWKPDTRTFAEVMPHMQALTDAGLAADIQAAYQWLKNGEAKDLPVGSTGYCMGGRTSIQAALTVPLDCAISYYGGGIAPSPMFPNLLDRLKDLKAPTLFFWGGLDAHIGRGRGARHHHHAERGARRTT